MAIRNVQAIAGVSAGVENVVMTVYPSIAATGLGRMLGRWYDSIPTRCGGIKISHLLFTLPTSPLALVLYATTKLTGQRYVLSNRRVVAKAALTERQFLEVELPAIDAIEIEQLDGQQFYRAADLVLYDAGGNVLGRLEAVSRAAIFRQTILEARDALIQTRQALETIAARRPA